MPKGLIFFCCACGILLFTTINLSIGPITSGRVGPLWGIENCKFLSDQYDEAKKAYPNMSGKEKKYNFQWEINKCTREKGMHDMEYTAFIFDIVIGFVCALLGLLHLFGVAPKFVEITGVIGIGCGGVGLILTLVYVILNGIVYTNYYNSNIYKRDGDGAFAEWKNGKYECMYYDDDALNIYSYYAKFSDIGKRQYNYNKDFIKSLESIHDDCKRLPSHCEGVESFPGISNIITDANGKECKYLYITDNPRNYGIGNKDISDRFLTTLILSLFVCLANIGLIVFGFLMAKTGEL